MNENKLELLRFLHTNRGQYISGGEISNYLGVSRTTISNYIKNLRKKGYEIKAKTNRGYCLQKVPDKIIPEEISLNLKTEFIGEEIKYYPAVNSTNEKAKELAAKGEVSGTLVISEEQEIGKGRLGRNWFSPPGTGLWFSLLLRPDFLPEKAPFLTIIASLAVSKGLESAGFDPVIKWPNDIMLNGKKVCGILSELSAEMGKVNYAVVGIGINVNQKEFPDNIRKTATSLSICKNEYVSRIELLQGVLGFFEDYYLKLLNEQETILLELWKNKLNLIDRYVTIKSNKQVYQGKAVGVSERGELLLKNDDGHINSFWAGDATILDY